MVVAAGSGSSVGSVGDFTLRLAGGDAKSVADFFQGMSEKERRTFIKPLRDFVQTLRWNSSSQEDWRAFNQRWTRARRTLLPAALAVFTTALAAAKFLRGVERTNLFEVDGAAVRQVLTERAPVWLSDLPVALLQTLEADPSFRLVEIVGAVAQVRVAAIPEYVRAWGLHHRWGSDTEEHRAEVLADPRLAEMVPLLFDDDENDHLFSTWAVVRGAVLVAVEQGLVSRSEVLDGCLRRLLRGGRAGAMQDQVAFWTSLRPVDGEVVQRVSSCISLLSSQNGTVARTFLAALKAASDHGVLDIELAVEAASIAVTRPEKNVVKTTLSWLDRLAAGNPGRAGELVGTIGAAFGAQAADLQERAVKLVGRHGKALGEDERGRLVAEAEVCLAPDLVATLAGLLRVSQGSLMGGASASGSGVGTAAGVGTGYPEIAPYVPRPLLPPISSPAELAEVVASLTHAEPVEAMVFERVLEAIVAFERADPAALQEAMRPVVEGPWRVSEQTALTPGTALLVATVAAAGLYEDARRHPHRASVQRLWLRARTKNRGWYNRRRTTPADFLILRAAEVQAALGLPDLPPLVAVPTSPSGFVAPETLAARLRECEALGTEPLDADFHQALLRLPADCGDVDVSGLTSVAGLRFAAWVAGERIALPEAHIPEPRVRELDRGSSHAETSRRAARGHAVAPGTLLDLAPGVWREPERCWDGSDWMACWPAILPSRPDLAAMAMIGGVDWGTAPASVASAVVLAEQDGAQDATHRVIAARLVSDDVQLRASGVDAALVLAARGLLDAAALGAALAAEMAAAPAGLRRAVPALRDLANGGAATVVWEATALMLPVLLPPAVPKTLSGTADLLVLATELAGTLEVRTPIAEVGALAQKKGGSAVVGAARRLEAVLGAG